MLTTITRHFLLALVTGIFLQSKKTIGGLTLQHRIEPPVLLSRLVIFVFAGMAVVLFVLFMTLGKMFPLNRPEIFFITTKPANSSSIQITDLPMDSENIDSYKMAFVMEYVRARIEGVLLGQ